MNVRLTGIFFHLGRLALKAFRDQKRRYFPHLEEDEPGSHPSAEASGVSKKTMSHVHRDLCSPWKPHRRQNTASNPCWHFERGPWCENLALSAHGVVEKINLSGSICRRRSLLSHFGGCCFRASGSRWTGGAFSLQGNFVSSPRWLS